MFFKVSSALLVLSSLSFAGALEGVWRRGGMRWDIKQAATRIEVKVTATGGNVYTYAAVSDGKEYPVNGFIPGTTVKLLSISDRSFETAMIRNGKELSRTKSVVSADGKLLNSETSSNGSSSHMIFAHY